MAAANRTGQSTGDQAEPRSQGQPRRAQRGGFVMGMVVGLLVGLGVALVVALYITKAPSPFVDKVPQRSAEQDAAETERNKTWDPNGPLAGKNPARPQAPASAAEPGATTGAPATDGATPPGLVLPPPAADGAAPAAQAAPARPSADSRAPRDPAAILAGEPDAPPAARPAGRESASASRPETAAAAARPASGAAVQFYVQAGAFSTPQDAEAQRAKLALLGLTAKVMAREQAGRTMYRVRLGPYDNRNGAEDVQDKLATGGIDANLVRVER